MEIELKKQVESIVCEVGNISKSSIDHDMPLHEGGLGLDSISIVDLIVMLEKKFEIHFTGDELSTSFKNISTLTKLIQTKLNSDS